VTGVHIGTFPWEALNIVVTLLWVVAITNSMNLLDNMDGLSGGIGRSRGGLFPAAGRDERPIPGWRVVGRLAGGLPRFLVYKPLTLPASLWATLAPCSSLCASRHSDQAPLPGRH